MYIEIDKQLIPYQFDIELNGEIYRMTTGYNARFDFFTIDIEKDGVILVQGEKLVLNKPLFSTLTNTDLPSVYIMPIDEEGTETRVTYENLGETVFLYVGEDIE